MACQTVLLGHAQAHHLRLIKAHTMYFTTRSLLYCGNCNTSRATFFGTAPTPKTKTNFTYPLEGYVHALVALITRHFEAVCVSGAWFCFCVENPAAAALLLSSCMRGQTLITLPTSGCKSLRFVSSLNTSPPVFILFVANSRESAG